MAENDLPAVNGENENSACCCGPETIGTLDYLPLPVTGTTDTPRGPVPVVSSEWRSGDYLGAAFVRLGVRRLNYAVAPGLYAVGKPAPGSPVFVSANYKLSFDVLRRELRGMDAWILVLDTKGINVWCAAGKGSFGTRELLGAPGVSAPAVSLFSEFAVVFGPVRARDIGRFMAGGMKADAAMRRVTFGVRDRFVVALLELVIAAPKALLLSGLLFVLSGIRPSGFALGSALKNGSAPVIFLWLAVLSGTLLTAIMLPYLPGRAFSVRGGISGALIALAGSGFLAAAGLRFSLNAAVSAVLLSVAASAYLALNFTGASTFTSLSGVKKEIRYAVPVIAGTAVLGILFGVLR